MGIFVRSHGRTLCSFSRFHFPPHTKVESAENFEKGERRRGEKGGVMSIMLIVSFIAPIVYRVFIAPISRINPLIKQTSYKQNYSSYRLRANATITY